MGNVIHELKDLMGMWEEQKVELTIKYDPFNDSKIKDAVIVKSIPPEISKAYKKYGVEPKVIQMVRDYFKKLSGYDVIDVRFL